MTVATKKLSPAGGTEDVELVGGPCCGYIVKWPSRQKRTKIKHAFGTAIYQYDGDGDHGSSKAFYVGEA